MRVKDIEEVVAAEDALSTLSAAIDSTPELEKKLKSDGPWTLFAPNNGAFQKLGDKVDALLKPANKDKLVKLLSHHVLAGKVASKDLQGEQEPKALDGEGVKIVKSDGKVTVDGHNVVKADIHASNGVVHIIDGVLVASPMMFFSATRPSVTMHFRRVTFFVDLSLRN